jgi:hypothetical protein
VNVWFALAAVVGLVLIAVVVIGGRRPRSAEAELGQPTPRPAPIGIDSVETMAELKQVLQNIQAAKGTGTLHVTAGGRTGSLYFLFGHLFHAVCGEATGEVAVKELLGWRDTQYTLDTKSPLPTEETIERPIDEILAA